MTSLTAVNMYLCANGLLVLAVAFLATVRAVAARSPRPIAYRHQLQLGYALTAAVLILPICGALASNKEFLPQTAQVWSAPTMHGDNVGASGNHRIAISMLPSDASLPLDTASQVAAALFLAGLFVLLIRIAFDALATARIIAHSPIIRRHGRLIVLTSDCIHVPFSLWVPTRHFIVMPASLLLRASDFKIALRHEAQHHRQQDTKLLYLYQLLKAVFFWNPAMHALHNQIRELQEFSCDEAIAGRRSISASAYCRCLLWVAECAANEKRRLLCASMSGSDAGNLLARRIEATLHQPHRHLHKSAVIAASVVALALMTVTAFAFAATIHDRRISVAEADKMAAVALQDSSFPIAVNDRVVEQLNLLLGTPDGRAYLQASLTRMANHKALIAEQIARHDLPLELLAVPLVESGYRNLPQSSTEKRGAGVWMFIQSTARRFGLIVDSQNDDRLDVAAETVAAMRLLGSLYKQYGDWGLALLAYNAGSKQVDKAIRETGSRDVWEITAHGHENDKDYLPRVMAAVLVIKNPSVLD